MIIIHVNAHDEREYWDSKKEEFVYLPANEATDLYLEHSLISISKWEAKWHVPFISKEPHTEEQALHYITYTCGNPCENGTNARNKYQLAFFDRS